MTQILPIDSKSAQPEALPDNLDVHSDTPTQIGVLSDYYQKVTPVNSIDGTNTIDFKITSSLNQVIDPSKTMMRFKFKILKEGGGSVNRYKQKQTVGTGAEQKDKTDKEGNLQYEVFEKNLVFPVNNIVQSMWSNVMVKINNQIMSNGDSAYPYRADIETKFMTSASGKKNLRMGGWYEETFPWDNMEPYKQYESKHKLNVTSSSTFRLGENIYSPIQTRFLLVHDKTDDGTVHVQGPIHSELFETNKVLPPGTTVNVIFTKSDSRFALLAEDATVTYKIEISDFELLVHYLLVDPDIVNEMLLHTKIKKFVYPLRKAEVKWITIGKDVNSINVPNLFHEKSKLPRRVFIAFVDQNAFNQPGSLKCDPFYYQHLNMSESSLRVGNIERPYPTIKYNWPEIPDHMFALQHATSTLFSDEEVGYYPADIENRNFVIPYKLAPTDSKVGECYEMMPLEQVYFSAQLKKPTDKVYQMIVYAEYDAEMHIDEHGKIEMLY